MNKCIVICGQTATGKSDLSVALSIYLKQNGIKSEIISADSRQVYIDGDTISAKITKKEMQGIKHHMISVVNYKTNYSVARYKKEATKIIKDLHSKNIIPIICGGTGLYIDNLVFSKTIPEVKPNAKLRKELEKYSANELFTKLENLDKERAQNIDRHNKVRLIRALEIIAALGTVPKLVEPKLKYETLFIGLKLPNETIKEHIKDRTNKRGLQIMLKEIMKIKDSGVSYSKLEKLGLEYKYLALLAQGKINNEECTNSINKETLDYAKRQLTWFKKNKNITWLDMSNKNKSQKEADDLALDFLLG